MATFTKTHYEPLAQMILEEKRQQIKDFNGLGGKALEDLAYRFVEFFERDNRNFSRAKFLEIVLSK